jgi:hypothetical protein
MHRTNLFRFATDPQSHAAFWGWVFQSIDTDSESLEGPRAVGESTVRLLHGPVPTGPVDVHPDPPIATGPHSTLRIDFDDGHSLFVTLRKESAVDASRIASLQADSEDGDPVVLISAQFDADRADGLCPYLDLGDLRELLWTQRDEHPLLSDYADWADDRKTQWDAIERTVFAESPDDLAPALSSRYGQHLVLTALGDHFDAPWTVTADRRRGRPRLSLHFAEAGPDQDALFYRVDEYAAGYCLSLKQYLGSRTDPAWDGKSARLDRLRARLADATEQADHDLTFREPHDAGSKTREVGCLLFRRNAPALVVDDLPAVHQYFTDVLEEAGWTVGVDAGRDE